MVWGKRIGNTGLQVNHLVVWVDYSRPLTGRRFEGLMLKLVVSLRALRCLISDSELQGYLCSPALSHNLEI